MVPFILRLSSVSWTHLQRSSRRWQGSGLCVWYRSCVRVWTAHCNSAMRSSHWTRPPCQLTAQPVSALWPRDIWGLRPVSVMVGQLHLLNMHVHICCLLENSVLSVFSMDFRWQMSCIEQRVWGQPLSWRHGVCGRSHRYHIQLCVSSGQEGQMLW